jgi:hypothetical protein
MTVRSFTIYILYMGFGAGLGTKWKASQSGKQNPVINLNAIHGGEDSVNLCKETLAVGGIRLLERKGHPQAQLAGGPVDRG